MNDKKDTTQGLPMRLLRKLRLLAQDIGPVLLRLSERDGKGEQFEYLAAADLKARLRTALHKRHLSATTPHVEVEVVHVGAKTIVAKASVTIQVVDLSSGESLTWHAEALCDGSAATASGC